MKVDLLKGHVEKRRGLSVPFFIFGVLVCVVYGCTHLSKKREPHYTNSHVSFSRPKEAARKQTYLNSCLNIMRDDSSTS